MRGGVIEEIRYGAYSMDTMRDKINEIIRILNECCPDGYVPEAHLATLQENLRTGNRTLGLARVAETQDIGGHPRNVRRGIPAFPPPEAQPATMSDAQLEQATGRRSDGRRRFSPHELAAQHQREPGLSRHQSINRQHVAVGRNMEEMRQRILTARERAGRNVGLRCPACERNMNLQHLQRIFKLMSILQNGIFYISSRPPTPEQVLEASRSHDALLSVPRACDIQEAHTFLRRPFYDNL